MAENALHRRRVCQVGQTHRHPEPREPLGEEGERIPVQGMIDDDFVSRADEGPKRAGQCSDAGRDSETRFSPFQTCHSLFEQGLRRIARSPVN